MEYSKSTSTSIASLFVSPVATEIDAVARLTRIVAFAVATRIVLTVIHVYSYDVTHDANHDQSWNQPIGHQQAPAFGTSLRAVTIAVSHPVIPTVTAFTFFNKRHVHIQKLLESL